MAEAAAALGWRCCHTWKSLHSVMGFPDLICVRDGQLLALALKSEQGRAMPASCNGSSC